LWWVPPPSSSCGRRRRNGSEASASQQIGGGEQPLTSAQTFQAGAVAVHADAQHAAAAAALAGTAFQHEPRGLQLQRRDAEMVSLSFLPGW
jgi:hypothetical protein